LLTLLPGAPRGASVGRRLGWQLTTQFVLAWLGALLVMTGCLIVANLLRRGVALPELLTGYRFMMIVTAPLSSSSMAAAVAWCSMRWVRMRREPSALPVGRLA
jgi:hypothetical protein